MKLYVGNLSFKTTQQTLEDAFAEHGRVDEVAMITDRETGQPRGFAFVTMDDEGAKAAMAAMNDQDLDGRALKINEARARENSGGGGGGYRGGSGGGGRGRSENRRNNW